MKTEDIVIIGGVVIFGGIVIAVIVSNNAAAAAAVVTPVSSVPVTPVISSTYSGAGAPIQFGSGVASCSSTPTGGSGTPAPTPNSPGGTGTASSAADSGLEINSATQLIINTLLDNGSLAPENADSLQIQLNSALMDNDFNAQYNTFSGATKELWAQINNLWGKASGSTKTASGNMLQNVQNSFNFLQKYNEQKAENVDNADMAYNVGIMTNYMTWLNNPQV